MDEEYLKMVLALPDEFIKNLSVKNGDQVFLLKDVKATDYPSSYGHGLYTVFENSLAFEGHICTEHWMGVYWLLEERKAIPIPSQEQLINMIKNCSMWNTVKLTDLEIITGVAEWHRRYPCKTQNKCCEQLYLEVLMWLNDKTWDGESWI